MPFDDLGSKKVVANFSGGHLSSDGGSLLLRQIDAGLGISRVLAGCFTDSRQQEPVEHSVEELVRQRLFGLALVYKDINDHAQLRRDPFLAAAVGNKDLFGENRRLEKDRGFACASAATLNRLELGTKFSDRHRKIHADAAQVEAAVLKLSVRCLPSDWDAFYPIF